MTEKIYPAGPGYNEFKKKILDLTGMDLGIYKYQIHRRVHTLMQNWGLNEYGKYFEVIHHDEKMRRKFLDYITINVTEFFRNPERWDLLREKVIPSLKKQNFKKINIWSAGCSYGQEAYSLAILAMEEKIPFHVTGADIDDGALKHAAAGVYKSSQLANMPENVRKRYFTPPDGEHHKVCEKLMEKVSFKKFNLTSDTFPSGQHLILCRNVVIYFSAETKAKLYDKFFQALVPGGFLMVGNTEQIHGYQQIGFESRGGFLYRKPL